MDNNKEVQQTLVLPRWFVVDTRRQKFSKVGFRLKARADSGQKCRLNCCSAALTVCASVYYCPSLAAVVHCTTQQAAGRFK
jgi:hypothetical protein